MNIIKFFKNNIRKIIILGFNAIILLIIFNLTIGNIFYAIDLENILLIKSIVILKPSIVYKKK